MLFVIGADTAPALGDLRAASPGDTVYLKEGATDRRDWSRYADAITNAVTRGADVTWVRPVLSPEESARKAWKAKR